MLAEIAREAARAGGIEYLDAWHLTHAHWWASWDGMHYSQVWGVSLFVVSVRDSFLLFCFLADI